MIIITILGIGLIVWSAIEEMGTPITNNKEAFIWEKSKLLKCIIAEKHNNDYRFIVMDGDKERFYKLPVGAVAETIDPDRFFRKNALGINIDKDKRDFIYYRP